MQTDLNLNVRTKQEDVTVEKYQFEPIKGYPMLQWQGKRPFTSTQFYPAQLKETYGEETDGWMNQIFWGDNLQVMSHLLKKYRGQVDLIYIDPPFDSKADYKKKIQLRGKSVSNDATSFEEKQYTDIWTNDEYLQFMYERLVLIKELLSENGSIFLHCDWHKSHYLRSILDEIFGSHNFQNEIIWQRTDPHNDAKSRFGWIHDTVYWFAKNKPKVIYNWDDVSIGLSNAALQEFSLVKTVDGKIIPYEEGEPFEGRRFKLDDCTYKGKDDSKRFNWHGATPSPKRVWPYNSVEEMDKAVERGEFYLRKAGKGAARCKVSFLDEREGKQLLQTIWMDAGRMKGGSDYPTRKPNALLERIIKASTNPGDVVFDCFMGSGTTQAVAMKLGRRFLGADINLGAIQTTIKRLIKVANELSGKVNDGLVYTGFQVYNVNHYDVFRNPLEAKELLMKALEIEPAPGGGLFDGEKDGRLIKVMPVNRIATRADLNEILSNIDLKAYEKKKAENPNRPVEQITLVCMGHEPDLAAQLKNEIKAMGYTVNVEVVDVLRDRSKLEFKRDAEAEITIENNQLLIREFYPMNLLQKLSLMKEDVGNWKELVESVLIDWNYDGAVLEPATVDIPEGSNLVRGVYPVPATPGTIRVKITDLLSESLEQTVTIY